MSASERLLMPKLGLTMTEGTLTDWRVAPGQRVRRGEILFVVETEKVANEVEAPADGVIEEIRVPIGSTVPVGEVLATWTNDSGVAARLAGTTADAALASPPPERVLPMAPAPAVRRDGGAGPRIVATPLARRLARQSGVDLRAIVGSGPRGRVKADDVRTAGRDLGAAAPAGSAAAAAVSKRRAATRYEATVAGRLTPAKRDVPHFYVAVDADIGPMLALRDEMNRLEGRVRVSVTHMLIAALARAMAATPRANRAWRDGEIEEFETIDIGLAVDTEQGLLVPILRDVGPAAVDTIAAGAVRLVERAKSGALTIDDTQGGAITLSNVGMHRVSYLTPIINPGQAAILGVGGVQDVFRPGPNGEPVSRREIGLVLACDHRIWDGVAAAAFLGELAANLAHPLELARPAIER